ncbi:hypothetical protein LIER_39690 [Lithospermum erythrorhizon]|uniref:Uncharacterized protein n=1 Tax=Lithospermum erythrorhizon TaxID=34254 RepID=A0AAV3QN04_LITER
MDAEIIRNLLKCNLTDEEYQPVHLEDEDLAKGIMEYEASAMEDPGVLIITLFLWKIGPGVAIPYELTSQSVKQCPSLPEGSDPRKDLAYDLWIKVPSEKSWIVFKLEEDLDPSDDVKALGGGPSKFKVSDEVLISGGDRGSPMYQPGFGSLLSDSDQHKGAGIELLSDFGGLLSSSSPRQQSTMP